MSERACDGCEWGQWHFLCYVLAHSLSDTLFGGWVTIKEHAMYLKAIEWANEWATNCGDPALLPNFKTVDRVQGRKILRKGEIDCLNQDIFTAIFTLHELFEVFRLEANDIQLLHPVLDSLEKKIPWAKFHP